MLNLQALEIIGKIIPCSLVIIEKENYRVVYANARAVELFGFNPLALNFKDYALKMGKVCGLDGEPYSSEQLPLIKALQLGQTTRNEQLRIRRPDQIEITIVENTAPLRDEKGEITGAFSLAEDITAIKKSEESLKVSEALYRTLFDNSDDGFILLEPMFDEEGKACDFRFLKVNRAYERQTGRKAVVVEGNMAREVAPDLELEWVSLVGEVVKSGRSVRYENYNARTNRWYDAHYFPWAKGQVGILFRDITERKKMEEVLRESQKKYQDLIETNYDFIWEMDSSGRYTYCSPQMEKLWGIKPAEMLGKTPFDVMPPSDKERSIELFKEMANSPKPFSGLQTTAYDSQGRLISLETNGVPFFDDQGRLLGYRGMSRDITERNKLEKQLQDQERLATIGATAGMVGHDIRNPLQAIVGDIYLLRKCLTEAPECGRKEELKESVDDLEKNISYINKIVADLQDFSRPLIPDFVNSNLYLEVMNVFAPMAIPDNINISIKIDPSFGFKSDPMFLRRILSNLFINAIQAMPNGGNLTISACESDSNVLVTVEDSGVGIPEDVKPKLFTPMVTTKSKGQGLGLAVVKRFVEALNGTIDFESQVGIGTKFIMELPIQ